VTAPPSPAPLSGTSTLLVILHGWTVTPDFMAHVIEVCGEVIAADDILVPELPLQRFSTADPVCVARDVIGLIDRAFATREANGQSPFDNIILIGHSIGGLIARKVYLLAGPESQEARFEDSPPNSALAIPSPWFGKIRRIILFAGMNRGWSISHHLNMPRAIAMYAGLVLGELVRLLTGKQLTILHVRKGARFITDLRLQWIALAKLKPKFKPPLTIQLLGSVDDLVAPSDNIDLVTGCDFIYLDVPFSGHENVVFMDKSTAGRERRRIFVEALTQDYEILGGRNLIPDDLGLLQARSQVTDVIFVIHGIRDVGYWTQKIARRVEALGNAPPRIYASETSTYGYFAMIPFLLPRRHRDKVHWLMDQYVEAKALYPSARFAYMGHSNGTYLLARALRDYKACRFERVVFAGSVVRTDYDWQTPVQSGQVEGILNYIATADWVVAIFPAHSRSSTSRTSEAQDTMVSSFNPRL
jgi:pimeloyl-ACP methyl ester carboxylesterase